MVTLNIDEASTDLRRLIANVEAGEDVEIVRGDQPIVKMVRVEPKPKVKRVPGQWKGMIDIGPAFFEPLPEDELRLWEGRGDEEP